MVNVVTKLVGIRIRYKQYPSSKRWKTAVLKPNNNRGYYPVWLDKNVPLTNVDDVVMFKTVHRTSWVGEVTIGHRQWAIHAMLYGTQWDDELLGYFKDLAKLEIVSFSNKRTSITDKCFLNLQRFSKHITEEGPRVFVESLYQIDGPEGNDVHYDK